MALLAIWALNLSHPPVETVSIPVKTMTLVSLNDPAPVQAVPVMTPVPVQPKTVQKPLTPVRQTQPLVSKPSPIIEKPAPPQPHDTVIAAATPIVPKAVPSAEIKPIAVAAPAPVEESPKIDISAEKKTFFASLRSKIQQNLHYPAPARRRGMEGEVTVRFVLERGGTIRNVTVRDGSEIFHHAAKVAVASASGVKVPEVLAGVLPTEIDLTLEFHLNGHS